jgi:hypothetical protein
MLICTSASTTTRVNPFATEIESRVQTGPMASVFDPTCWAPSNAVIVKLAIVVSPLATQTSTFVARWSKLTASGSIGKPPAE